MLLVVLMDNDLFTKMLQLTNKHIIGVHMLNNGFFKLYYADGERIYQDSNAGYKQAINDMENL